MLGAASYRVYRNSVLVDSPTGTTSSSTGLTPSTQYAFQVSAVNSDGEGPKGTAVAATTLALSDTTAPSVPTGVTAAALSTTTIRVNWNASSDTGGSGLAGYRVYRATTLAGTYSQIGSDLSAATLTYSDTTLTGSTTRYYKVLAFDGAGNASAQSTAVNATTRAGSTPGVIRFNPGHYMTVDIGSGGGGLSGWLAQIAALSSEPAIKGVKFAFNWDDIEPTTQGNYNWTILDQIVSACAAAGKTVMLIPAFQYFSGSVINPAGRLPTYVINNNWYYAWNGTGTPAGNLALAVRLDITACMNAFIAAGEAAAARYNSNDAVEMWMIGETALDIPSSTGFTVVNWIARLKAWMTAMRSAWSSTGVRVFTNYLDTDPQMQDLLAHAYSLRITCGGPDNYSRTYQSNPIYTGFNGGIDYRNRMPWASENQRPTGSSGGTDATSAQIYAHNESGALSAGGSTKPNYYVWSRTYQVGGEGETWSGQVLPFIRSIGGASNTVNPYLPTAPVIAATSQSSSSISVTLTTPSSVAGGTASYILERATNAAFTANLVTEATGASIFPRSVTGLSPSTQYYFRARATDGANQSANSSTVSATTSAASSGLYFEDDFTSYPLGTTNASINKSQGGFSWVAGSYLQTVDITSFRGGLDTNRAVEFNFGSGNLAELRWQVASPGYTEMWWSFYLYYPTGAESPNIGSSGVRSGEHPFGGANNKFWRFGDGATHDDDTFMRSGWSTDPTGPGYFGEEDLFPETGGPDGWASPGPVPIGDHVNPFTQGYRGIWRKITLHHKAPTILAPGRGQGNGVMEVFINDALAAGYYVGSQCPPGTRVRNGYMLGFVNGIYVPNTKVYMTKFKSSSTGYV